MAKKKAAEEEGGKPKKDKKKLIAIVVALAGAWKFGLLPIGGSKAAEGATTTTQMHPGDAVAVGDPIVVNLSDTDQDRYARVGIAIVLPGHGEATETHTTEAEEETTTRRSRTTTATTGHESTEDADAEDADAEDADTETTADHASETEAETETTDGHDAETDATEGGHSLGAAGLPGRPAMAMAPRSGAADPAAELEPKFPRLRASAISIIRTYSAAELLADDGPANLEADISEAAYEIYGDEHIYGVIITELIVQ
jgi:flagellar basal body-associated protein FliL